jgi:FkbM family methyltransferase
MLLHLLRPGDQAIDVGAHIGTFTVPFARTVGASGRVLAVEAGREAVALLVENLALNQVENRVRVFCAVATDRAGPYRAVPAAPDHTSAMHYVLEPHGAPSACLRLDALAVEIDPDRPLRLIKIDVEGMDLCVLRSADGLIRDHRPLLYVEVDTAHLGRQGATALEVEEFLLARRYALFRNVGPRNSTSDAFRIARLDSLAQGGRFFDCLAVPEERIADEPALPQPPGRPPRRWWWRRRPADEAPIPRR